MEEHCKTRANRKGMMYYFVCVVDSQVDLEVHELY